MSFAVQYHEAQRSSTNGGRARVMGAADSHDRLRSILVTQKPCKLLDVAAGQGALAKYLKEDLNWDVHCCDINPGQFRAKNLHCQQVNLNLPLPYEDSSFDAVVCANAVHRLANVGHTIAELYRVIRPGGRLYLNMNNYSSIDVRIRFLLCGSLEYRPPEWEIDAEGDPQMQFRQHVMYGHVANCLESVGFRIERVMPSSRVPMIQKVMIPLALMVKICTRLLPKGVRTQNQTNATSTLSVLTGGHYVLIDAIKK